MAVKPLSPTQYRALLAKLELSQVRCAHLLGVAEFTSRRWAANGAVGTAAIVLRLLMAGKITISDLEEVPRE